MPDWSTISVFAAAALILVFLPGPNTLYIIARSLQQGLVAGIVSSMGIQVGTLFHVAAAAFGLSALLLSSEPAFNAVKYAGAAYLIFLGVRTFLTREDLHGEPRPMREKGLGGIFSQGIAVNALNPKTALFVAAFLPTFIEPETAPVASQAVLLGAILVVLGSLSDLTYVLLARSLASSMLGNSRPLRAQRYLAGSVYIGLGAVTALTGTARK